MPYKVFNPEPNFQTLEKKTIDILKLESSKKIKKSKLRNNYEKYLNRKNVNQKQRLLMQICQS